MSTHSGRTGYGPFSGPRTLGLVSPATGGPDSGSGRAVRPAPGGVSETLTCRRCGESKPLGEFSRNRTNRTGRQSWCKPCCRAIDRERQYPHRRDLVSAREYAKGLYDATAPTAVNMGAEWTGDEDEFIQRNDMTLTQIAVELGRTYGAVAVRRNHLKKMNGRAL